MSRTLSQRVQHMSWKKGGFPAILLLFPENDANQQFGCQHVCKKMLGWYCGIKIYFYNFSCWLKIFFFARKIGRGVARENIPSVEACAPVGASYNIIFQQLPRWNGGACVVSLYHLLYTKSCSSFTKGYIQSNGVPY